MTNTIDLSGWLTAGTAGPANVGMLALACVMTVTVAVIGVVRVRQTAGASQSVQIGGRHRTILKTVSALFTCLAVVALITQWPTLTAPMLADHLQSKYALNHPMCAITGVPSDDTTMYQPIFNSQYPVNAARWASLPDGSEITCEWTGGNATLAKHADTATVVKGTISA